MNRTKFFMSLALAMFAMVGNAADNLPNLRVVGKNLVDANGKTVVLHGVMDTPNRYFNGWRWQQWKADYSEADIKPCLEYFSKQFAAITDKEQGAYCTVFRLHMDPCWTNDPSKKAASETCPSRTSISAATTNSISAATDWASMYMTLRPDSCRITRSSADW
jgi:endoglucanase